MIERLQLKRMGGDIAALKRDIDGGKSTAVFYATGAARPFLTASLGRFFLYITPDRPAASKAAERLKEWLDRNVVLVPEKDEVLLNAKLVQQRGAADRTAALGSILNGTCAACVISAEGLNQRFPARAAFESACTRLQRGVETPPETLTAVLAAGGYHREELIDSVGQFSLRGDILDVWAAGEELPARIEFFGDEVESIRYFAPDSMMSVRETESLFIYPISDILVTQNGLESALKRIRQLAARVEPKAREKLNDLALRLETNPNDPALTWGVPFFLSETASIFDYLPADAVVVLDEPGSIDEKIKLSENVHKTRVKNFAESGEALPEHRKALFAYEEVMAALQTFTLLGFQQITGRNPMFEPASIRNIKMLPVTRYSANYPLMAEEIKGMLSGGQDVLLFAGSAAAQKALGQALLESDMLPFYEDGGDKRGLNVLKERIGNGFLYPQGGVVVIGTDDAVRRAPVSVSTKKARDNFLVPVKGDYVVHETHGIGISEGVMRVDTRDGARDYYVVLYKDGDRLYLPVDQINTLEKYAGGGTPSLHRLGGKEFERVKERVRAGVKKLAIDLVDLYEKRLKLKGHRYEPDTVWQKELEESFEYQATDDQLMAVAEMKEDMESGKVMDRLLCGDVGFGKTEVALRIIFKTVLEGKQAAFLSPTTILTQQHYNTLCTRFKEFGIKVDILSRFVPQDEIKRSLKRIESGETSVVVATHRLLSNDVKFKDLGLLVLDEEQRFGVEHKEKIKVLKNNINVLSLSATPIPRTLHMALSGIRDISTLSTPPANRLPVQTYVLEYSDTMLRDAVRRELNRGGQTFILFNRVQGIEAFYRHVCDVLGDDARVIWAHGQMAPGELEERIKIFYDKQADVLVSTTIIENGIDLPDANTLIVLDADRLGLSALYQLRGRVGRSFNLAYAYFTVPEGKVLTADARKRLDAITAYTELGSGFKIAMQDLEIRGAGNVLGREQHGNMEKVGYDLYCRILREVVGEIRGVQEKRGKEVEMTVDGDTSLPADYIRVPERRVEFYKRVASLSGEEERRQFVKELSDVYGSVPRAVENLTRVGVVKNLSQKLNAKLVQLTAKGWGIQFYDDSVYQHAALFAALEAWRTRAVFTPTAPPAVVFDNKKITPEKRLADTVEFLSAATADVEA